MADFELLPLTEVAAAPVADFLVRMFGPSKGGFLARDGRWWHRGDANRLAVVRTADGAAAAYCAVTPVQIDLLGETIDTIWWIDLIVDPAYRRQGLQTLMDGAVRGRDGLKLGFPNEPHSHILARHGWAVRGDLRLMGLPLRPNRLPSLRHVRGRKGQGARLAAALLTPAAAVWRQWWAAYRPRTARQIDDPTAEQLADVYARYRRSDWITTRRTAEHIQWRYLDAPYRAELEFYLAGPAEAPTHYAVARRLIYHGQPVTRILDCYGDWSDITSLTDLLRLIGSAAAQRGDVQVTALAGEPVLMGVLARLGFWMRVPVYFCWHDSADRATELIRNGAIYWTLGDSDNDPPQLPTDAAP